MISVVSHDFRTPLANVRMMLEMQQGDYLEPGDLETWMASLNQQLKVSYDALEGLLTWAKTQLQAVAIVKQRVALHALVERIYMQCEEDLRRKALTFKNTVPAEWAVYAEPGQLEIVVRNLINNAIKFSYDGGVIRIYATADGAAIALHVEDEGMGMSEADLETLFQPDKVSTRKGTHNEKGTGIGLIISREMIQANGGDISARSAEGAGSTFTVVLNRY
jgi:signal transduction histidine kinase